MIEEWRDVPGYEGYYQASNQGQVKSLARTVTRSNGRPFTVSECIMRPALGTSGHRQLTLNHPDKPKRLFGVHRLVLMAFVGPCPEGMEVCHNNGIPTDNTLENLRYGTRSENMRDRIIHGADPHARKTHCPQGHPYDEENTVWFLKPSTGRWGRHCATCRREQWRAHNARLKLRRAS